MIYENEDGRRRMEVYERNDGGKEENRNQQRRNRKRRGDVGNGSKQLPRHGTQEGKVKKGRKEGHNNPVRRKYVTGGERYEETGNDGENGLGYQKQNMTGQKLTIIYEGHINLEHRESRLQEG